MRRQWVLTLAAAGLLVGALSAQPVPPDCSCPPAPPTCAPEKPQPAPGCSGPTFWAYADDAANLNGGLRGSVSVVTTSRLWGGEANLASRLLDTSGVRLTALAGFRYLDLEEVLRIRDRSTPIGQPLTGAFIGTDVAL